MTTTFPVKIDIDKKKLVKMVNQAALHQSRGNASSGHQYDISDRKAVVANAVKAKIDALEGDTLELTKAEANMLILLVSNVALDKYNTIGVLNAANFGIIVAAAQAAGITTLPTID